MTEAALWTIAGFAAICAGMLGYLIRRGEELTKVLEVQIKGLGATHLAGFEALTIELQRLEKRVKKVEDVMP